MIKADEARRMAKNAREQYKTSVDDTIGRRIMRSASAGYSHILLDGTFDDELKKELEECGYKVTVIENCTLVTW